MAYLPKDKYRIKYTNGNEFILNKTNQPYIGDYIALADGRFFAGEDLDNIIGPLTKLSAITNSGNLNTNHPNNRRYFNLKKDRALKRNKEAAIQEYTPLPTPIDYSKGNFRRFLVLENNTRLYKEISEDTYTKFDTGIYDKAKYSKFSIIWSLKEDNERINTEMLLYYESRLPGIFNYFPDKGQFGYKKGIVNLKNDTGARVYPDGVFIDKKLPRAYQMGNANINAKDNNDVPDNQNCKNCIFSLANRCSRWSNAEVKENYWCAAWETKVGS